MNDSINDVSSFRQWQQLIQKLSQQVGATLVKDHYRLKRRLAHYRKIRPKETLPFTALEKLAKQVDVARQCYAERLARFPVPRYTLALPIVEQGEKIKRLIHDHQVIVICSATGSGKTTQIPKLCLELKRGSAGFIGMTQPRRIAARSLATFLSNDLGCKVGEWVGYKMRFADQVQAHSLIKIMTDGLLLAELQHDPLLLHYDTLIVDEAHERSLNIDFLLGHLKRILPKRPDLKLIIASATLDHEKFSRHFSGAPVLSIPGKSYPIEVLYRPPRPEEGEESEHDLATSVLHNIHHLHHSGDTGDVLVFLPGEADIRDMTVLLRKVLQASHEILPVHARLASREQDRIFTPGSKPRIILATNVAETSLTVPGIRHVIDPGLAKIKHQDVRGSIQRLVLEKISRASADQRKGRCGRTAPGVCIRLYSQEDYEARPPFTDPEIVRTSLAAIILGMKAQGVGAIDEFPFMDPPSQVAVQEGWRLLAELKAVDSHNHLTPLGKQLARLPIDPRLGRMILEAPALQCLDEILIIASALSIPDPREWPLNRSTQAEELHGRFVDKNSDFLALLNLWRHVEALRHASRSKTAFNNALKGEFIAASRVREWWEIYAQLKKITKEMGYPSTPATEQRYVPIHKAILAGHVGMIGLKKIKNDYAGCRNTSFHIHPGSVLFKKSPTWIVAAELVETTRLYARVCARVEPEWIEAAAGSACKRDYYEATWEKKSGQVMALEKVSYSGLPLIMNRKIPFGPIDPGEARKIFIQEALVGNRLATQATFLAHNQSLIQEIRDKEHKTRRRDLLIQEAELFALYDRYVPPTTYCARHFHHWYFHAVKHNPHLLHFERHELLRLPDQPSLQEQFPGHLTINGQMFSLEYHFNPGAGEDGLSVRIPLAALSQCSAGPFEWLVPGMLPDKLTAMLKALPKSWRKPLVPVPDTVALCLQHLDMAQGVPLSLALTRILKDHRGIDIPAQVWRDLVLPDHWLMNFMIMGDDSAKVIQQGRDLEKLKTLLGPQAQKEFQTLSKAGLEQHGLTRWTFGDLPQQIEMKTEAGIIFGFPVLVDQGQSVSLQVLANADQAQSTHRRGMIRLLILNLPQQVRQLKSLLHFSPGAILIPLPTGTKQSITSEMIDFVIDRVFLPEEIPSITTRELFHERLQEGQKRLFPEAQRIKAILDAIHIHYRDIQLHLKTQNANPGLKPILPEIKEQLDHLIYPAFLWQTPFLWLKEYPRYLKAILKRIERRTFAPIKDSEKANRIKEFYVEFQRIQVRHSFESNHPELELLRWMLEEFRVSLFAQELGTAIPVSEKRLRQQIKLIT